MARSRLNNAVTLDDVAAKAGVARSTASRALSGSPQIMPDTRRAVERAAEQLKYTPNRAARTLSSGLTGSIGFVFTRPAEMIFSEPFFANIVNQVNRELAKRDLQLVVLLAEDEADYKRVVRYAVSKHVDGVLIFRATRENPLLTELLAARTPLILGGAAFPEDPPVTSIDFDHSRAAGDVVKELALHSSRRIGFIGAPQSRPVAVKRLEGFREGVLRAGVESVEVIAPGADIASGVIAMRELLELDLDSVLVGSDLLAIGGMRALRESGRALPVVAFDDGGVLRDLEPEIGRVEQRFEHMASQMVELLLKQIADIDVPRVTLSLPLELRLDVLWR